MHHFKTRSLIWHLLAAALCTLGLYGLTALTPLLLWLISLNVILFFSFGWDKRAAQKQRRRIPESTFLTLAVLGAFPALFLGRKVFRHKTLKRGFIVPMWLLFILQMAAVFYLLMQA